MCKASEKHWSINSDHNRHSPYLHVGEGNGNPLQYSCLENPVDGRTWWAAVHRVPQSQTRVKIWHACMPALGKEMATHSSILA